jgi:hypothetical protein
MVGSSTRLERTSNGIHYTPNPTKCVTATDHQFFFFLLCSM